ncbi:hypothetical protein Tco_0150945 [Tanacetum coccineum]
MYRLLELALIHTELSSEGRLFLDDLDQRTLLVEQHKPPPSCGHKKMPFSTTIDRLEKTLFPGAKLVSWDVKKQNCTAMSLAEAGVRTLSAVVHQSNVDEDTASRLWL